MARGRNVQSGRSGAPHLCLQATRLGAGDYRSSSTMVDPDCKVCVSITHKGLASRIEDPRRLAAPRVTSSRIHGRKTTSSTASRSVSGSTDLSPDLYVTLWGKKQTSIIPDLCGNYLKALLRSSLLYIDIYKPASTLHKRHNLLRSTSRYVLPYPLRENIVAAGKQ